MGTTARQRFQLLRAEMMVQNAFYNLRDAGDALMDAGCSPQALAVHGLAAQAAAWRQDVERMREGDADGDR